MPSQTNLALTYALLVFIWATTPLAIVWSVSDLYLMWALLLRFFIALPLAVTILLILRTPFPTHRQAVHSYIAGSFSLIGSQIFTYAATQYLSSGMIALMFGLAPIMAGLIGRFAFGQQLYKLQWLGMAIAVSGLAIICLNGSNQHVHPFGIVLMLISVFVYSFSIFWVKKVNAQIQPMAQATGSINGLYFSFFDFGKLSYSIYLAICTDTFTRGQIFICLNLYGIDGFISRHVLLFQAYTKHSGNDFIFNDSYYANVSHDDWSCFKS